MARKGTETREPVVTIRWAQEDIEKIESHLARASPSEDGAFVVLGLINASSTEPVLLVREVILPEEGDWEWRGTDQLTPTTDYIARAVARADFLELGLGFIHSHPDPNHPAGLSWIDEDSTQKLFANLSRILPGAALASLVFTPTSFAGIARIGGEDTRIARERTIGGRVATRGSSDAPSPPRVSTIDDSFDRQVRAIGKSGQAAVSHVRVGIVGLGGTGSAIAEQLARLGVRHFVLIDDDKVESTNLTRVYGSTANDVTNETPKVSVAKRNIKAIAPDATVFAHAETVLNPRIAGELRRLDIVFSCTDTDSSRAALNDLVYSSFVPVLDMGCRLDVSGGDLRAARARTRYLRPGGPCLWCTGTIDGRRILEETMSTEERRRLAESGYGSLLGPQPSVIQLTSLVASLAVNEFLQLVANAGPPHDGQETYIELMERSMTRVSSTVAPRCRCEQVRAKGERL